MSTDALHNRSVTIIGGGKMGEAMATGWLSSGVVDPSRTCIVEPSEERRAALSHLGMRLCATGPDALPADVVVLAVKPQVLEDVVVRIAESMADSLVISVAAGISTARLESMLPAGTSVVRVMPNTPAMVGEGMAVISGGEAASADDLESARLLFDALGQAVIVDESCQNAATAISGSGPAYFALVVDAISKAGAQAGLSPEIAFRLALQTMKGTSALLAKGDMMPTELIKAVSSPGGTTVAALEQLDDADLRGAFSAAVAAAVARAKELGA